MSKDPNYSIKVEQAIAKKYGKDTVQHPKKNWDDKKEREYLSQIKDFYNSSEQTFDEVELEGVLISRKLITRESKRTCPVCNIYSFKSKDDVYMSKFDCCEKWDGDQMKITKKRLEQIIKEEVSRVENASNEKRAIINEIISIVSSFNEGELNRLHEKLKRYK